MKKIFFSVLFAVILLHTLHRLYTYTISKKIEARVVSLHFDRFKLMSVEVVTANNEHFIFSDANWYGDNFLKENEKITLLYDQKNKEFNVNTFFGFWFKQLDVIIGFFIVLIICIVLMEKLPEKKPKVNTWK